jgi:hypothetical protein
MSEYAFRKIDIDALDEDVILPSDLYDQDPRGPDAVTADAKSKSQEARGQVSKYALTSQDQIVMTYDAQRRYCWGFEHHFDGSAVW